MSNANNSSGTMDRPMNPAGSLDLGTAIPRADAEMRTGRTEAIAMRAYFKAEQRGFESGHELEDWVEAEAEIASEAQWVLTSAD